MTDREIIAAIQAAAQAVNPSGKFLFADLTEGSQHSSHGDLPLIQVARLSSRENGEGVKNVTVALRFLSKEGADGVRESLQSSPEESAGVVFAMEDLYIEFMRELQKNTGFQVTGIEKDPLQKVYSAVLSGYVCRLTIETTAPC